jgi:hypothetical protein
MQLELGPEIILSYKRLAYEAWYALAEFVDNSTQSYFNNKKKLDKAYAADGSRLTVEISIGRDSRGDFIRVTDNSIGMSEAELENAVYIGRPPLDTRGRSRYGLGLKTGASWFGDLWTVETKKLGETTRHKITVDVPKVAEGKLTLPHKKERSTADEHGTTIEIRRLHRKLSGRALGKAKEYLSSLYRRDIANRVLVLKVNGEPLSWDAILINASLLNTMEKSLRRHLALGLVTRGFLAGRAFSKKVQGAAQVSQFFKRIALSKAGQTRIVP